MKKWLEQIRLESEDVSLIPLLSEHEEGLLKAASDGELWNLWVTSVPSSKTIEKYIIKALEEQEKGQSLPFTVIDNKTDAIVGSTRFMNVDSQNKRLEIGSTWYAKSHQKTGVNTHCKLMLLQHAFEQLHCIAVEFRTNWFNFASRNAILKLGAKQDGVLRNHRIDHNGLLRDTVVFSITNAEWPSVKKNLLFRLQKHKNNSIK